MEFLVGFCVLWSIVIKNENEYISAMPIDLKVDQPLRGVETIAVPNRGYLTPQPTICSSI